MEAWLRRGRGGVTVAGRCGLEGVGVAWRCGRGEAWFGRGLDLEAWLGSGTEA